MPFPRKITPQQTTVLLLLALTGALIAFLIPAVRYFRTLTGAMAVSNASDLITQTVSNIVENEMRLLGPDGGKFVSFEKDGDGQISAIVTDTSRVNILSAELLNAIVEASDRGDLDLSIPFGNLLGISFFSWPRADRTGQDHDAHIFTGGFPQCADRCRHQPDKTSASFGGVC